MVGLAQRNVAVQGAQLQVHGLSEEIILQIKRAIRGGSFTRLNAALAKIQFRLPTNADAHSLLKYAVRKCKPNMLSKLITYGAPVTGFDSPGEETLLHLAVREYNKRMMVILLKRNVNILATNLNMETPVHVATKMNYKEIVFMLLDSLAEENQTSNIIDNDGLSLFHIICTMPDSSYAEKFLQAERTETIDINKAVSVNSKFRPGFTALHFAASNYRFATVKILIERGAKLNVKIPRGLNALHLACVMDNVKIVLLDAVINPFEVLDETVREAHFLENFKDVLKVRYQLVEWLLEIYDADARDAKGNNSLMFVAQNVYPNLNFSAIKCYSSRTTLDVRKLFGTIKLREILEDAQVAITKLLLKQYNQFIGSYLDSDQIQFDTPLIGINFTNNDGHTCLHRLAVTPDILPKFLYFLLKCGADVHAVDKEGKTPLHAAAESANASFIYAIMSYKETRWERMVNINATDNEGRTPLRLVKLPVRRTDEFFAHNKCFCLLLEFGAVIYVEEGKDQAREFSSEVQSYVLRMIASVDFPEVLKLYDDKTNFSPDSFVKYLKKSVDTRVNIETVHTIWMYLEMMQACNCFNIKLHYSFFDKIKKKMLSAPEIAKKIPLFIAFCEDEVRRMKEVKVSEHMSLCDVIRKNTDEVALYTENETLKKKLGHPEFEKEFRIYGRLLKGKYVNALRKNIRRKNERSSVQAK